MKYCKCGCGQEIKNKFNSHTNKLIEYIHGHNSRTRKVTWGNKISKALKNKKKKSYKIKDYKKYIEVARQRAFNRDYNFSEKAIKNLRINCLKTRKKLSLRKTTDIEKIVYNRFDKEGFNFIKQFNVNNRFLVDAYFPKRNLIVEIDSKYWHSLPNIVRKDKAENAYLLACSYQMLRFQEKDIRNNLNNLIAEMKKI